ncbi:MAG: cytochrome c peroxidase, partial [Paracoccaceae bacterium]
MQRYKLQKTFREFPTLIHTLILVFILNSGATAFESQILDGSQFHPVNQQKAKIGQLLFYDKILSGNRNISCSTCHHPK